MILFAVDRSKQAHVATHDMAIKKTSQCNIAILTQFIIGYNDCGLSPVWTNLCIIRVDSRLVSKHLQCTL